MRPDHLGGPANFYVEPKTNEIFIADGYINKRVVVYDAATGAYKRHWGAYGKVPNDTESYQYPVRVNDPPQQYSTLHGLVGSKDGLIYVSDRQGNRIHDCYRLQKPHVHGRSGQRPPHAALDPEGHASCRRRDTAEAVTADLTNAANARR